MRWKPWLISSVFWGTALVVSDIAASFPATAQPEPRETALNTSNEPKTLAVAPIAMTTSGTVTPTATITTKVESPITTSIATLLLASQAVTSAPSIQSESVLEPPINSESNKDDSNDPMAQVTSVSQLRDVQPTDWAFQALQSLIKRYGVTSGYSDRTFRGHRGLTRYEFTAALNAALNRVNELIAAGTADLVRKSDLAILQKLQVEFALELATLRGRVDTLEARTAQLEANQFSPTTKLDGEVIFAVTAGSYRNRGIRNSNTTPGTAPSGDLNLNSTVNPTVVARTRLNFSTSFTGKDLLFTQLQSGNGGQTAAVLGQVLPLGGNYRFNTFDQDYAGSGPGVALNYLFYKAPLFSKNLQFSIGPVDAVNNYVDINRYSQDEATSFSSTFFKNNPLLFAVPGGAVASLSWNPSGGALSLHAVYASGTAAPAPLSQPSAEAASASNLFGSPNQGIVEVEYARKTFTIRLQYMRASVSQRTFSIGGVNAELALTKKIGLFGRYGFGTIDGKVPGSFTGFANTTFNGSTLNPQSWQTGVAFFDFLMPGGKALVGVGQPFIENHVGNSTQTNLEALYRIPLSDNIAISPDLQFIFNPNNNAANSTIVVGTIRTVLTF